MEVHLRPAQPADALAAAPLIYSSGPPDLDYIFEGRESGQVLEFIRYAFAKGTGELGFSHHTVAILNNEVVGVGTGFCGKDVLRFTVAGVRDLLAFYGFRKGCGIMRRFRQVERVVRPPKGDLHYIAHIGVAKSAWGQSIGFQIMQHLLDEGRRHGRTLAALDVVMQNTRALTLYKRLGFEIIDERISTLKSVHGYVPNHYRMEKQL